MKKLGALLLLVAITPLLPVVALMWLAYWSHPDPEEHERRNLLP